MRRLLSSVEAIVYDENPWYDIERKVESKEREVSPEKDSSED